MNPPAWRGLNHDDKQPGLPSTHQDGRRVHIARSPRRQMFRRTFGRRVRPPSAPSNRGMTPVFDASAIWSIGGPTRAWVKWQEGKSEGVHLSPSPKRSTRRRRESERASSMLEAQTRPRIRSPFLLAYAYVGRHSTGLATSTELKSGIDAVERPKEAMVWVFKGGPASVKRACI